MEKEIDFVLLLKVLWRKRRLITICTSVFFVLGILLAFSLQVEYKATCRLMPESQDGIKGSLGGLSGLAGLAGIDLGAGTSGSLTPDIYPQLVASVPFQLDLMHLPLKFKDIDSTVSSYKYFNEISQKSLSNVIKDYTIGLPFKVIELFGDKASRSQKSTDERLLEMNKKDWKLLESFSGRTVVSVDIKTGIISISSEMPDAYAAASMLNHVLEKLTSEISNYKTEKAKSNLDFIQERYNESLDKYLSKQKELDLFSDKNRNLNSSQVQSEYQYLQNEVNIAFEIFKSLATQLEQAKIKVQEEIPVFTILEPAHVPYEKSKPSRLLIIISTIIFGILFSFFLIYSKEVIKKYRQRWLQGKASMAS